MLWHKANCANNVHTHLRTVPCSYPPKFAEAWTLSFRPAGFLTIKYLQNNRVT